MNPVQLVRLLHFVSVRQSGSLCGGLPRWLNDPSGMPAVKNTTSVNSQNTTSELGNCIVPDESWYLWSGVAPGCFSWFCCISTGRRTTEYPLFRLFPVACSNPGHLLRC
ncbi:hypothetical protein [Burkholderia latens]|uniref:Uncharacterized protein n=1 Tax=Burkholderia latens TaxID=488446 RepID=A0A6H9TE43_9BURK|nr:hypothetical protein [Burkholderia latens]KAB0633301.1 hypothetical protein F7R21_28045 [Burkholderia latens]